MASVESPLRIVDDVIDGAGFGRTIPGLNGPPAFVGRVVRVTAPSKTVDVHPIAALSAGPLIVDPVVTIAARVSELEFGRIEPHHNVVVCYDDAAHRWTAHPLPPLK